MRRRERPVRSAGPAATGPARGGRVREGNINADVVVIRRRAEHRRNRHLVNVAVAGTEWLLPVVPWPLVSNPAFPPWLLLVHWLAVLVGAIAFLGGYFAALILGLGIANANRGPYYNGYHYNSWEAHVQRCYAHYKTYDHRTDTYISFSGYPRRCNL